MNESVHKSGAEIGLALARLHSVQSNANLREAVSFVKMALGGYETTPSFFSKKVSCLLLSSDITCFYIYGQLEKMAWHPTFH